MTEESGRRAQPAQPSGAALLLCSCGQPAERAGLCRDASEPAVGDAELELEHRVRWLMLALGRVYAALREEDGPQIADQLWAITVQVGNAPRPFPRDLAPEVAIALTRLIDSGAASPEGLARLAEARQRAIEVALARGGVG